MDRENNPGTPPVAEPLPPMQDASALALASPWIRLGAQVIDVIILMIITLPMMFFTGFISRTIENSRMGGGMFNMLGERLVWAAVEIAIYIGINWVFLQKGQTIGKKAVSIRIVRKDGNPIDAIRIITHRILPVQFGAQVPCLGSLAVLVDTLLIFRSEHNTLHDDIADTKVVVVPSNPLAPDPGAAQ